MSINKLISIKNPIVDAMDMLSLDHDKFIPLFTRWATQAENEIGSYYQYVVKRCVLDITDCTACLPNDAMYVQIALLGDLGTDCADLVENACNAVNLPNTYGTAENTFLVVDYGSVADGSIGTLRGIINHQIQNNKLIFEQNYDGQKVTIQYLAVQTDCDGFVEISQNHVLAIRNYICWNYFLRKRGKSNDDFYMANLYEREWHRECSHARAQDAELTITERMKIVGMYHNPVNGIGLSYRMNTTLGNGLNIF